MKYLYLLAVLVFFSGAQLIAQTSGVSINETGSTAHPSAGLDVSYTDKGVLIPRMTAEERNAIVNPAIGLQLFNTTTNCFNFWTGTGWRQICGDCEFNSGSNQNSPVAGSNGPLCDGDELHLTASSVIDATYQWTGPCGFSSTEQNPVLPAINGCNSGTYYVTATAIANGCVSAPGTIDVTINQTPWATFTPAIAYRTIAQTFVPTYAYWDTYSWEFEGATPSTSTDVSPSATWADAGTYNVTLTVTTAAGCSNTVTNEVVVENPVYSYTGDQQTFIVPEGVTSLTLECWGAEGGTYCPSCPWVTAHGGKGGYATGTLAVTPGTILYIYVGGQGFQVDTEISGGGGYNGGGNASGAAAGGGGATDIRVGGIALTDRIIVAGGGGGGGLVGLSAGAAGGLAGESGGGGTAGSPGGGGQGGSQSAGGDGGSPGAGEPGTLGFGGNAGNVSGIGYSGGGGGGYYGGGGGGGEVSYGNGGGGSGGGGSSYIGGVADGSTVSGLHSGPGVVVITY